jgi:hypothetical protein
MLTDNATVAFWLAAAGGVLLAGSSVVGSRASAATGAALFVVGVVWFFIGAVRRSRKDQVALKTAVGRASKDALRFALYLMP